MPESREAVMRHGFWDGIRLGVLQASALLGPPALVIALVCHLNWALRIEFGVIGTAGLYGWGSLGFARRVR